MVEPVLAGIAGKIIASGAAGALKQAAGRVWKGYKGGGQLDIPARRTLAELIDFIDRNLAGETSLSNAVPGAIVSYLRSAECITLVEHILAFRLSGRIISVEGPLYRELEMSLDIYGDVDIDDRASLFRILVQTVDKVLDFADVGSRPVLTESATKQAHEIATGVYLQSIDAQLSALTCEPPFNAERLDELLQRYRQSVIAVLGSIQPPNFDGAATVEINDLYTAPSIAVQTVDKTSFSVELRDLIQLSRLVILGDPGGGKTTLTRKVSYDLARGALRNEMTNNPDDRVPIVVVLSEFAQFFDKTPGSIAEFIEQLFRTTYQLQTSVREIEWILATGRAYVIFDGLDELLDTSFRQKVSAIVNGFAGLYPSIPILVTSRRVGYLQAPLPERSFTTASLNELTLDRVKEYVEKWFRIGGQLSSNQQKALTESFMRESEAVADLRRNPLMLALMCTIYRAESYIPRNRPDVYEKCARMLFDRWDRHRGLLQPFDFEAHVESALMSLAHWLYVDNADRTAATEMEIIRKAADYLQQRQYEERAAAEHAARQFVEFCRGRAWVFTDVGLSSTDERLYQFTHRTFLEYFTAAHLARTTRSITELADLVIPQILKGEWDVVSQLAFQIKSRSIEGGADDVLDRLLSAMEESNNLGAAGSVASFIGRCLSFLTPAPMITKRCARSLVQASLAYVVSPTNISHQSQAKDRTFYLPQEMLEGLHRSAREARSLLLATGAQALIDLLQQDDPSNLEHVAAAAWRFNVDTKQDQKSRVTGEECVQLREVVLPILRANVCRWPWAATSLYHDRLQDAAATFTALGWHNVVVDAQVPGFNLSYLSALESALIRVVRGGFGDETGHEEAFEQALKLLLLSAQYIEGNHPTMPQDTRAQHISMTLLFNEDFFEQFDNVNRAPRDLNDEELVGVALILAFAVDHTLAVDHSGPTETESVDSMFAQTVLGRTLGELVSARLEVRELRWSSELLSTSKGQILHRWTKGNFPLLEWR